MRQTENRAVKKLQVRLRGKKRFGILHLILTVKLIQKPIPFRGFKNTFQRNKPVDFTMLFAGKIPGDSKKIPFEGPLLWVELSDCSATDRVKNCHKDPLREIFSNGNGPRHMCQEPIHRTPMAVIKVQKGALLSLL